MKTMDTHYSGLLFSFDSMLREIKSFATCAQSFLTPESSERVLDTWQRDLLLFRASNSALTRWSIAASNPIQSIDTSGFDRAPHKKVFVRVSCVWEIHREPHENKRSKLRWSPKVFRADGLVSTLATVYWRPEATAPQAIASWSCEIGDKEAPGGHFHTQVKGTESENGQFPLWLPVPRLPTILITPVDLIEFALSELFQNQWYKRVSEYRDPVHVWNSEQKERFRRIASWQDNEMRKSEGSVITRLKRAKPHRDLFTGVT